jgi:hypothetical protein
VEVRLPAEQPMEIPMSDVQSIHAQIDAFSEAYRYDASYLGHVLDAAPGAFHAFAPAQGVSKHREELPLDAHFVGRIAAARGQACGPCAQLNLRMALEAGVARGVLETLVRAPEELPAALRDVHDHAFAVTSGAEIDHERIARLRESYGEAGVAELAVCIVGASAFPTLKRALGREGSCVLGSCEVLRLDF